MTARSQAARKSRLANVLRHPALTHRLPGVLALVVFIGVVAASALLAPPRKPIAPGDVPGLLSWSELRPAAASPSTVPSALDLSTLQDSDPRAARLLRSMRAAGGSAPLVSAMEGREVALAGYVVPLDGASSSSFLLVPYFGACIHTPPPPANQVVHVIGRQMPALRTMDRVVVRGRIRLARSEFEEASSGYRIDEADVEVR